MDTKGEDHRQTMMNKLGSEYSHRCFRQNKPTGALLSPYLFIMLKRLKLIKSFKIFEQIATT